jgi:hypothetical protein
VSTAHLNFQFILGFQFIFETQISRALFQSSGFRAKDSD